jgi:hypothetical protein
MDFHVPGRDTAPDGTGAVDHAGFAELLENIRARLRALGLVAAPEQVDAAALDIVQDVASFTLAWAECDEGDATNTIAIAAPPPRLTVPHDNVRG